MIMTWTSSIAFVFLLLWQTPNVNCTDDLATENETDSYIMPIKQIEGFELKKKISDKCEKLGICDDVLHYPETIIDDVISNLKEKFYPKIFYSEVCPFKNETFKIIRSVCRYEPECFTPKAVKSHAGTWHLVLNTKESPLQVFTGQVCKRNKGCGSLEYKNATCKQVYFERPMIVLNSIMNAVVLKHLPVPCCCKCYVYL